MWSYNANQNEFSRQERRSLFSKSIWMYSAIFFLISLLWFTWPKILQLLLKNSKLQDKALYGDMYGALNTLFSGMAFAGILVTIILQGQQIRDAKLQAQEQQKIAHKDRFESSFFQLINTFNQVIDSFCDYVKSNQIEPAQLNGRKLLHYDESETIMYLKNDSLDESARLNFIKKKYEKFLNEKRTRLHHYFNMLNLMIEWINKAEEAERGNYADILRAQLSPQELTLIFFHCLSDHGSEIKSSVEKYSLLINLSTHTSIAPNDKNYFNQSAFGKKV